MERIINVGNKDITFRASALTASKYRDYFQLDLFDEFSTMSESVKTDVNATAVWCIGTFERLAYIMAAQEVSPPLCFEKWMEGFPLFALREAMPDIAKLWVDSTGGTSTPKKK